MSMFFGRVSWVVPMLFFIAGCSTVPQAVKRSSNYLEKGIVSSRTKGNEFYMAIGQVDLYERGFWGNLKPRGRTVEIAVAIQADKDTGQVLRIATIQPQAPDEIGRSSDYQNGAILVAGSPFALGDLYGGIAVTDMQPYPRWLDALVAMKKAIADLGTYSTYGIDDRHFVIAVVNEPWLTFDFGRQGPSYRRFHRFH